MKLTRISAIVMCLSMTGCATFANLVGQNAPKTATSSYVEAISLSDADIVARDMADFLSNQFASAKTTIELEPMNNEFHARLLAHLKSRGFGIVETGPELGATGLRYAVTQLDEGIILRMKYQGKEASQFYPRRQGGTLALNNVYTVREAAK